MRRVESKPVPLFPGPNDVFAAIGRGLLASRGLAPPPWRWTRQELLFELLHKGVLVGTTHLAFRLLEP